MAVEAPPAASLAVRRGRRGHGASTARSWALGIWSALALLYLFIPIFVIVAVLVQRPEGPLQLHLAGLHARPLAAPVREPGPRDGAEELAR